MASILKKLIGASSQQDSVDKEENDEFAELAMEINFICEKGTYFAHAYKDDNESDRLEAGAENHQRYLRFRDEAITRIVKLHDEFYQGFAIHHIAKLCKEADDLDAVRPFFRAVEDEFIREKILEDCPELEEG